MGFLDFLPGASKNQNVSMNTRRQQAAQRAYYKAKQEYGRAPISKVANVLQTPGIVQKTNVVAIRQQQLTEQFIKELSTKIKKHGTLEQVQSALTNVIKQIDTGLKSDRVRIEIPVAIGRLLKDILTVILWSLGVLFSALILVASASGNANLGTAFGASAVANTLGSAITSTTGQRANENIAVNENIMVQNWQSTTRKTRKNRRH